MQELELQINLNIRLQQIYWTAMSDCLKDGLYNLYRRYAARMEPLQEENNRLLLQQQSKLN